MSVCAFAQSGNQPLKGDVNEDGKVDVSDIVAVVNIILNGGSTPQPAVTYYWYVGHNNPMNMTDDDIIPLQSNDASEGPGWRTIGTTLPTYNQANPFWDEIISTATSKSTQYVALPSDQIKSRNAISGEDITAEGWTISSEKKTLKGVDYTIWTSKTNKKSFADLLY